MDDTKLTHAQASKVSTREGPSTATPSALNPAKVLLVRDVSVDAAPTPQWARARALEADADRHGTTPRPAFIKPS
ncbi:MAG: hypothetical protein ABJA82_04840 [Myxococcales bacterium]